jgi:hypothetical protein
MPTLAAIRYRLFEGEESVIQAAESGSPHDFGGELVLSFQDGRECFISWVAEPVQYAMGIGDSTHFVPDARLFDHDVSRTATWVGLIGQEVRLGFAEKDNQILKVSSQDDHVLLCAFERGFWWADQITVCRQVPAPYDV